MATNNPHKISIEEDQSRTRLGELVSVNRSTDPINTTTLRSTDEIQRLSQADKQTRKDEPYYAMQLFSDQGLQRQNYYLYISSEHSESATEQFFSKVAHIEREQHGAVAVPRVEPPATDGKHHQENLADAPKLQIEVSGVDNSKCYLLLHQGTSNVCCSKEDIQRLNSSNPPQPCMEFEMVCNACYARITMTDFHLVVKGLDENGEELYETIIKYPLKFDCQFVKNTPSERSWQDQASCIRVTQDKNKIDAILPEVKENIQQIDNIMEFLHNDGVVDKGLSLSWQEPVGELLQYLLIQPNGIEKLIAALKSTQDSRNLVIAELLQDCNS